MNDLNNSPEEIATRVARQLAELARVAEVGLGLCREILAKTKRAEDLGYDPSHAYSRISRAVRLTIVLENRIAAEHQLVLEGKSSRVREDRITKAKAVVLEVLHTAIESELKNNPDCDRELLVEMRESLPRIISERVDKEDLYETAPISEVIEIISQALDIPVDWSLWINTEWISRDRQSLSYPQPPDTAHPAEVNPDTEPVGA